MSARSSFIRRLLARQVRPRAGHRAPGLLEACLGPLEVRVLETLWQRTGEAGVRDILGGFPGIAYTTLMTTLDRLHKKGCLERRKDGRAYLYSPRYRREELEAVLARDAIEDLLRDGVRASAPEPVLVGFVEAIGGRDARMLDELERLVRRYRAAARRHSRRGGTE